jgi:hypothetical protein
MKQNAILPISTQVRVVKVCKQTGNTIDEKMMLLSEWVAFKRNVKFYYKAFQV